MKLGEPFYLNVVKYKNDERWFPVWDDAYAGSRSKTQAVALRNEFLRDILDIKNSDWQDKDLRTVKVAFYELPFRKKNIKDFIK